MKYLFYKVLFLFLFLIPVIYVSYVFSRGFDGSGPNGLGSRTGRGMGNCKSRQGVCLGQGFISSKREMGRGRYCRFINSVNVNAPARSSR